MTAPGSDPYAVLGVPRDASEDQIARARRRLSREYHPDVNSAPDAAARFDEIQQAYRQLAAARPRPGRVPGGVPGERGRTRVARDPGGGYATEASPGLFIQPAQVDFGRLTPARPRAEARIILAWTGASPVRLESTPGGEWWACLGSERPATACVVFYLRAHAHARTRSGRQQAQFTLIVDDTTLVVELTAEIEGEFPPGSRPDFAPRSHPGTGGLLSVVRPEMHAWLLVVLAMLILVLAITIR